MSNYLDIFSFSEYRSYIKSWLENAKKDGTSNLSRLSESVGVHTSYLGHVLSGAKNLSLEQATELSEVFNLTNLEHDYFIILVQLDRAGSHKLKKYWLEKKQIIITDRAKVKSRVGEHAELSAEDRAIFYSSWIYVALFVATAINDGQSLEQLSTRFNLSRSKAEEFLNFLVSTGICEREGGIYKMGKSMVYLSNESPLVVKHHTNWRIQGIQKMDTRESSELFYTSPMSMSLADFEKIREILSRAIESSLEICRASPAEEIVCLNIDFFKLAKK